MICFEVVFIGDAIKYIQVIIQIYLIDSTKREDYGDKGFYM